MFRFIFFLFIIAVALPAARTQDSCIISFEIDTPRTPDYNAQFNLIRKNPQLLRLFFGEMPKGGDIHHHYAGALYPELFIKILIKNNYYIHPVTLVIKDKLRYDDVGFEKVQTLIQKNKFDALREKLLRKWSARNFNASATESNADFFFKTFGFFGFVSDHSYIEGLIALKKNALREHVRYIETMLMPLPPTPAAETYTNKINFFNQQLTLRPKESNQPYVTPLLDSMYAFFLEKATRQALKHNQTIQTLHQSLALDDDFFTMRYQNYIIRTRSAAMVFEDLLKAFISADASDLIVGVNIVGPEHHPAALQDYELHMQMYAYLKNKYPKVKYSLHAGELTLNLGTPGDLSHHIHTALFTAQAQRIGHGVSIAYEKNAEESLQYMAQHQIPVEINLASNAFILNMPLQEHPVRLYRHYQVPVVLSTDDAGVLRTTLTEQFVLLARHFPEFSYEAIKEIIRNSIRYSFLEDAKKEKILEKLERDTGIFEHKWFKR